MNQKALNTRQWKLYQYLKKHRCPCDNVDIAVKRLVEMDTIFGYEIPKRKPKQLSLF